MDGVFETGLDVIEHEVDLGQKQGALSEIERLLREGLISQAQHEELLLRHLNQQKIFAFGSYDEFYGAYFRDRSLVADEDMRRVNRLVRTRKLHSDHARHLAKCSRLT